MDRIVYLKDSIFDIMGFIEKRSGVDFDLEYPEYSKEIWIALDAKNKRSLIVAYNKLCKLYDLTKI